MMTSAANNRFRTFMLLLFLSTLISSASADTNVGGDILGNTTWTLANSPYIVTSDIRIGGLPPAGAILTIEPGVIVKLNQTRKITVGFVQGTNYYGRMNAIGTAAAPIQFIANTASPTQGYWNRIEVTTLGVGGTSAELAFVTIKHAQVGLSAGTARPIVHHCTFESNTQGLTLYWTSSGSPTLYQNNFVNNGSGTSNWGMISNNPSSGSVESRFCWWNSVSGPSLTGGGVAQRVSAGIIYDPWLTGLSSPSHYFISGSITNRIFNPNIGANFKVQFTSNQSGNWTVTFLNNLSQPVKTFTGTGITANITWDGKNDSGVLQPNGNYTYRIESTSGGNTATSATGNVTLDTNRLLTITSFTATPTLFSASVTLNGAANFDDPTWTLTFRNSVNTVVKNASGSGTPMTYVWDGKDNGGTPVPDGQYTAELQYTTGLATVSSTVNLQRDATQPTAIIHSPVAGMISNIYNNGSFNFPVVITVSDPNLNNWTLKWWQNGTCCVIHNAASGTTNKINQTVYTFQTFGFQNGNSYSFELAAVDNAGNLNVVTTVLTIGHFNFVWSPLQLNASQGQTVTFTSNVPFPLIQTSFIKNSMGQTVRNLIQNVSRSAGTYNDIWDGRNNSGQLVPDGPYFYVAEVTVSGSTYTLDFSNLFPSSTYTNLYSTVTVSPTNDPFNNLPLVVNYTVSQTSRIVICFSVNPSPSCVPPITNEYQLVQNEYQASGPQMYKWVGLDLNGIFRPEAKTVTVIAGSTAINSAVVYGTKSVISSFTLGPAVFSPLRQSQNLSVNFSTYQSQPATITVTFKNHQSSSVLRTIVVSGVTPGQANITWDGKADSGALVSPGVYIVTLTIPDALGNQTTAQLLSTVKY